VLDESKSLRVVQAAIGAGRNVLWHDPYVEVSAVPGTTKVIDLPAAIREVGAIFILTPHAEYSALPWDEYDNAVEFGTLLVDCWRTWPVDKVWKNFKYFAMGREEGYPAGENEDVK
jgi:UDP-N-acetyl-D-mannosaminuronate dehydrogenase